MSPATIAADRKRRSPITVHEDTTGILQDLFALAHIRAKGLGRQPINPHVIGPVARQLVPIRKYPSHQRGVPPGDPTQYEKRRLSLGLGENVENAPGVAFNPLRQAVPFLTIDR